MPTAMVATAKTVFEELTMLTVSANVPLTGSELPTEPALSVTRMSCHDLTLICRTSANANICSGRGTVSTSDCQTCNCNACSNGGTVNTANCQCTCQAPWTYNTQTKDCTTCSNTRAGLCNNHGICHCHLTH